MLITATHSPRYEGSEHLESSIITFDYMMSGNNYGKKLRKQEWTNKKKYWIIRTRNYSKKIFTDRKWYRGRGKYSDL